MRLIRYYRKQPIDLSSVDTVRTIINETITEGRIYRLEYPSEVVEVHKFDEAKEQFARRGCPLGVKVCGTSSGGRYACFDTTHPNYIVVEYHSNEVQPTTTVSKIEQQLALRRLDRIIRSAFIAHGFDKKGETYALEVSEFLRLIGIEPITGRPFEPSSVSEKVKNRIDENDAFIAIATPKDDQTWLIQETTYAESKNKYPFLVIEKGTSLKPGILGDREYIDFEEGHLSESFIRILQGLRKLSGNN